jgi:hypothetical protein
MQSPRISPGGAPSRLLLGRLPYCYGLISLPLWNRFCCYHAAPVRATAETGPTWQRGSCRFGDRRALSGVCIRQLGGLRHALFRCRGKTHEATRRACVSARVCARSAMSCVTYSARLGEIEEHHSVSCLVAGRYAARVSHSRVHPHLHGNGTARAPVGARGEVRCAIRNRAYESTAGGQQASRSGEHAVRSVCATRRVPG